MFQCQGDCCIDWLAYRTVDAEIICVIDMLAWRKIIFVRYYRAAVITAESHHPRRLVQREQWVVNILAAAMWEADKCREGGPGLPGQAAADPAALTGRHQNTSAFFQNSFFHNCTHKNNSIYIIFALPCFRFCPNAGHGKIVCDGIGCFRVELVTAAAVLESSWRWQQLWGLSSSLWSQRAVSRTPANQVTTTQRQRGM